MWNRWKHLLHFYLGQCQAKLFYFYTMVLFRSPTLDLSHTLIWMWWALWEPTLQYSILIPYPHCTEPAKELHLLANSTSDSETGRWEMGPLILPLCLPQLLWEITFHVWWLMRSSYFCQHWGIHKQTCIHADQNVIFVFGCCCCCCCLLGG